MVSKQVPANLLKQLTSMPGGINQSIQKFQSDIGLSVDYNAAEQSLKISGASSDIHDLAFKTFRYQIKGYPEDDVIRFLENTKVVCLYKGDVSDRIHFFHTDIRKKTAIHTQKGPAMYTVSWAYQDHERCMAHMEEIEKKLKTLYKDEVSVYGYDMSKANLVLITKKGIDSVGDVKFLYNKDSLGYKIIGTSKKCVDDAKKEFQRALCEQPVNKTSTKTFRASITEPKDTVDTAGKSDRSQLQYPTHEARASSQGACAAGTVTMDTVVKGDASAAQKHSAGGISGGEIPMTEPSRQRSGDGYTETESTSGASRITRDTYGASRITRDTYGASRITRDTYGASRITRDTYGDGGSMKQSTRDGCTAGARSKTEGKHTPSSSLKSTGEDKTVGDSAAIASQEKQSAKNATYLIKVPSKPHYRFDTKSGLVVFVYKESITSITGIDAIVNAANKRLCYGGGVAGHIEKAAGSEMTKDCEEYINKYGHVDLTNNCVTTAGKMSCDKIIHAVGPQWHDYRSCEDRCAEDLYNTIINILVEAQNSKFTRIAVPAISSGIFGVPKHLCAQMYVKALVEYDPMKEGQGHLYLKEVHLIDILDEILKMVIEAHKEWQMNKKCLQFKNAFTFVGGKGNSLGTSVREHQVVGGKGNRLGTSVREHQVMGGKGNSLSTSVREHQVMGGKGNSLGTSVRERQGERGHSMEAYKRDQPPGADVVFLTKYTSPKDMWIYALDKVTLKIYSGDITQLDKVDAVVCPVDSAFHGGKLAKEFLSACGKKYKQQLEDLRKKTRPPLDGDVFVCKTNRQMNIRHVLHVCMSSRPTSFAREEVEKIRTAVHNILTKANTDKMKSLAIPLIGAAHLTREDVSKLIQTTINAISLFVHRFGPSLHLSEIHLVNLDKAITLRIQAYLREKTEGWDTFSPETHQSERSGAVARPSLTESRRSRPPSISEEAAQGHRPAPVAIEAQPQSKVIQATTTSTIRCMIEDCKAEGKETMTCGHCVCAMCFLAMKPPSPCLVCDLNKSSTKEKEQCIICMDDMTNPKKMKCGHQFCAECMAESLKHKPVCPICGAIFGVLTGNQPMGTMDVIKKKTIRLPGYEKDGAIVISYSLPDGKQGKNHPRPGMPYRGTRRTGYLPDNSKGNKVFRLLTKAWDNKLVFTIGDSRTTGKQDIVTWNDIHHKTSIDGGPSKYGYPDPTYLDRVLDELAAKGVTE